MVLIKRNNKTLLIIAWAAYILAWFVPVHKDGVVLPEGLPGWQALHLSLSPLLNYFVGKSVDVSLPLILLWAISGATNVLMLCAAFMLHRQEALGRLFWLAMTALLINANLFLNPKWWGNLDSNPRSFITRAEMNSGLRIGYFLWCLSFLVFGRRNPSDSPAKTC